MDFSFRNTKREQPEQANLPKVVPASAASDSLAAMSAQMISDSVHPLVQETLALTADCSPVKLLEIMRSGQLEDLRSASGAGTVDAVTAPLFALHVEQLVSRGARAFEYVNELVNDSKRHVQLHFIDGLARHGQSARELLVEAGQVVIGETAAYLVAAQLQSLRLKHDAADVINSYLKREVMDDVVLEPMLDMLKSMSVEQRSCAYDGLKSLRLKKIALHLKAAAYTMLDEIDQSRNSFDSFSIKDLPKRPGAED